MMTKEKKRFKKERRGKLQSSAQPPIRYLTNSHVTIILNNEEINREKPSCFRLRRCDRHDKKSITVD